MARRSRLDRTSCGTEQYRTVYHAIPNNSEKDEVSFNSSNSAGGKSWVAGVELATAGAPPARKPRIWGRRPLGVDPSHPRDVTCV